MPTVTFDGRSFMLDGRRTWVVSGSIHIQRIPREQWADRIHAARLAGLNTVEIPLFWSQIEPRAGQFDFTGRNDIRHAVELVRKHGLSCILRPGPYVGEHIDLGGIPAWLADKTESRVRQADQVFLESVSRYISAVADQVRDLQVVSSGGGPILLITNEIDWVCGKDDLARGYLGELDRYLRESGLTVPTLNANNLWHHIEGEVDAWAGDADFFSTLRQLAFVNPDTPRLVADFDLRSPAVIGQEAPAGVAPLLAQRRLAEVAAALGQFSISPFCSGTSGGFTPGRLPAGDDGFVAPTADVHACIDEVGMPTPSFGPIRRLTSFLSNFGRVLAHADPQVRPVVLDAADPGEASTGLSVIHASGSQGGVAFVFSPMVTGKARADSTTMILPDGQRMDVPLGEQHVHWFLFDVHIGGRATLDMCGLCALSAGDGILVCYGPAERVAMLSINGSPLEVEVPKGRKPLAVEHESVIVIICNEETIDQTFVTDEGVYVGVESVTADGEAVAGSSGYTFIDKDGNVESHSGSRAKSGGQKPALAGWAMSSSSEHADGSSPRYAAIDGPGELADLGSPYGYGWYRLTMKQGATKRVKVSAPQGGDRFQLLLDGAPAGVLGRGPGAASELPVSLKKGQHTLVVLADNMGRYSGGTSLADSKGLAGHLWETASMKLGKPELVTAEPLEPLEHFAPLMGLREGDRTHPDRLTWAFTHRRKSPIIMKIDRVPMRALLLVNDEPHLYLDQDVSRTVFLDEETLSRGNNVIQLAVLPETDGAEADADVAALVSAVSSSIDFVEGTNAVSAKAEWAFAKWEPPGPATFEPVTKSASAEGPTWWRCTLTVPDRDAPVRFDPAGLTKGQVFLNGRHVGKYFAADAEGNPVPPNLPLALPATWLDPSGHNELMIFDEHGGNPTKSKLIVSPAREVIRASVGD